MRILYPPTVQTSILRDAAGHRHLLTDPESTTGSGPEDSRAGSRPAPAEPVPGRGSPGSSTPDRVRAGGRVFSSSPRPPHPKGPRLLGSLGDQFHGLGGPGCTPWTSSAFEAQIRPTSWTQRDQVDAFTRLSVPVEKSVGSNPPARTSLSGNDCGRQARNDSREPRQVWESGRESSRPVSVPPGLPYGWL
jgi:hypothetical protein